MLTEQCTLKPATRLAYMSDIHINQPVHCTSRGGGGGGEDSAAGPRTTPG